MAIALLEQALTGYAPAVPITTSTTDMIEPHPHRAGSKLQVRPMVVLTTPSCAMYHVYFCGPSHTLM